MLQVSRLQKWNEAVVFFLVCSILIFSEMPTWGKGLALMCMGFFLAYQRMLKKPTARLVQVTQFDKENWRWSVLEPLLTQKTHVYEGRLIKVQGGLFVLVLRFETKVRQKTVMTNWVVWRDQVDAQNWRRLIVIARFWADEAQRIID